MRRWTMAALVVAALGGAAATPSAAVVAAAPGVARDAALLHNAQSPFGKGVLIALKGAERGCIPGSGNFSCPEPIRWTPGRQPLVVNFAGPMTFQTGC